MHTGPIPIIPEGTASDVPGSAAQQSEFGAREKLAIWLLLGSAFIVIMNEMVMGVATAVLMRDLDISAAQAQWFTTAYMLTMAIVIPTTGLLIQRFSTRGLFGAAMLIFTIGTIVAAIAPGFTLLLVGRVIQAVGTALTMPLLMTTVTTLAPPGQRGQFMSLVSVVFSVAPAFGPPMAGVVLQWLDWRWMFIIMLPIAMTALVVGTRLMPSVGIRKLAKIDALSIVLSGFGFGGIVYGLSAAGSAAMGEPTLAPWIPLSVGVTGAVLFVWRQLVLQREDRSLLDMQVFSSRPFTLAVFIFAITGVSLFGALFLIPLYAQNVLGYGPLLTGLLVLPGSLLSGVLAPVVGRTIDKRGGRGLLIAGMVITAISVWSMMLFHEHSHILQLFATNIVMNIGLAGVFTPMYAIALGSLPGRLTSHGSATLSTVQQLSGAAGVALLVTVMTLVAVATGGVAGAQSPEAVMSGIRISFMIAAIISTMGIALSCFARDEPAPSASNIA